jgi:hypothetical protein
VDTAGRPSYLPPLVREDIVRTSGRGWLVVTLGVAALAGPLVDHALAKRPKARFSARVDGKPLKALKRAITLVYSTASFSAAGPTKIRRGVTRTITFSCLADLKTLVPPAPLICYGTYTEARRTGAKDWSRDGMEVTIQSVDGDRVAGTFRGTLDPSPSHAGDPPVTVEAGSFSIVLTDLGV